MPNTKRLYKVDAGADYWVWADSPEAARAAVASELEDSTQDPADFDVELTDPDGEFLYHRDGDEDAESRTYWEWEERIAAGDEELSEAGIFACSEW